MPAGIKRLSAITTSNACCGSVFTMPGAKIGLSPDISRVFVAKGRRRRQGKARAGRAIEAYLRVRRGARPSATQPWRMDPVLQQKTREKFGLGTDHGFKSAVGC